MENNSKLWIARLSFWILSTIDSGLAIKVAVDAGKGHTPLGLGILFVILTAASIAAWILSRRYKADRGKDSGKTLNQIEVEALAAFGAQQRPVQPPAAAPQPNKQSPDKSQTP